MDDDPKTNPLDPTNSFTKLSEASVDYVDKLVEYYDFKLSKNAKTLPEAYGKEKLVRTLEFVESYSKITEQMNRYGADSLVHLLNEMLGEEEYKELMSNERYKQLLHAINLQAQGDFYNVREDIGRNFPEEVVPIDRVAPNKGIMLNWRLDPKEMEILRQRWEDRDVLLADGEDRLINLRYRTLSATWYFVDGETGRCMNYLKEKYPDKYSWWDPRDTDAWLRVALKNAEICPSKREEILAAIKRELTPEEKEWFKKYGWGELETYQDFLLKLVRRNNTSCVWGESGKRWGEYYDIVLKEGTDDDRLLFALIGYVRRDLKLPHEEYVGTVCLYASFLGKNVYGREGTIPVTGDPFDGLPDGGCAPVISEQALEAILKRGNPIYDPETGAWPTVFGVDPEILAKDKVKYVKIRGKQFYP